MSLGTCCCQILKSMSSPWQMSLFLQPHQCLQKRPQNQPRSSPSQPERPAQVDSKVLVEGRLLHHLLHDK